MECLTAVCIYCKLLKHQFHETIEYNDIENYKPDELITEVKDGSGKDASETIKYNEYERLKPDGLTSECLTGNNGGLSNTLVTGIGCNRSDMDFERSRARTRRKTYGSQILCKRCSVCVII